MRYKLVIYVPVASADEVRQVIGEAGAGRIGNYANCSFTSPGVGRFLPLDGANPAIGEVGKAEEVEEERIEVTVDESVLTAVISALKKVHPYEEPAYDVYRLEDAEIKNSILSYKESVIYLLIAVIFFILSKFETETGLTRVILRIFSGSLFIAFFTQCLHVLIKSPHVLQDWPSRLIRLTAGVLELALYTFTITFGRFDLLAGFLVLKALSVWENKSNPTLEGASAGILRLAIVVALGIAIIISIKLLNSDFVNSSLFYSIDQINP